MFLTIVGEIFVGEPTPDEPTAPIDGLLVVNGPVRVEDEVQERHEVLRRLVGLRVGGVGALGLDVHGGQPLALLHKDVRVSHISSEEGACVEEFGALCKEETSIGIM